MEMRERKEPKFVTFADGEVVEGVLTTIEAIKIKDKIDGQERRVTRYTVLCGNVVGDRFSPDGESESFLGTHRINTALTMADRGKYVRIRCEGSDPNVGKGGNQMKLFKIEVSSETYLQFQAPEKTDSLEITNDDIPF